MIEQLQTQDIISQLQELPKKYLNRIIEYQKLPFKTRKKHTCISFINFITTGKSLPFFDPKLWVEIKYNNRNLKAGNILVFLPNEGSDKINHCAMSIGNNKIISKDPVSNEIIISDFLDIVERYEDTKHIGALEHKPTLT